MHKADKVSLNNGVLMDQLGYGVYKVPPGDTRGLCTLALESGYRTLDTAALYGNEDGVGQAVNDAVANGQVQREDVFVTSKLWNDNHGFSATLAAFESSLAATGLEYLDLYLIHWPCPAKELYVESWRALEKIYHSGRVRAIGVSNFQKHHLEQLVRETDVVPAVNQIELHPLLQQHGLRAFHESHGIVTQAWSPLGRGAVLTNPTIGHIAAKLGRTPAQVILRWHLQAGVTAIPKASSRERIAQNLDVYGFELSGFELAAIAELEADRRFGSHPDQVN
ncbi:aldo/keto reductase [Arthrobacter sp. H5]|uniref:aldo/keto reductase n=1 Tax=Arthrobacter sp. H5 TaxID=1267973 RepID=UPI00047F64CD|nr:aldo/keto reductase [Arthrobacter sp. H5]